MNSLPRQNDDFIRVKSKKMNSISKPKYPQKYNKFKKHDALDGYWGDPKGWIKHYHCNACHGLMTKKEPTKKPQVIYSCGCIVCASCIVQSYFVKLNPNCPVDGCGKLVNPKADKVADPFVFGETPNKETIKDNTVIEVSREVVTPEPDTQAQTDEDKFINDLFTKCMPSPITDLENENKTKLRLGVDVCHCGDEECGWDCGVLWCGCIDVCRGRCGIGDGSWYSRGGYW